MYWIMAYALAVVLVVMVVLFVVVAGQDIRSTPPRRNCPLCGKTLGQSDRVYADEYARENAPSELKIKGCTYCYRREDDSRS